MKVISIFQYALRAHHNNKYESIDTLSKAEHCQHLVKLSRTKTKLNKLSKTNTLRKVK